MKLYFVRHGESEANLLREISNRGTRHGLTAKGREQATALAQALSREAIQHIYTSPLLRAVQTAEILAGRFNVPFQTADALREFDCGFVEGRSDTAAWEIHSRIHESWLRNGERDARIDGGESFNDIRQRFIPFVEGMAQAFAGSESIIVLVGHGGTYRCMLPLILRNIDDAFIVKHGISYTCAIVAEPMQQGLVCTRWGAVQPPAP